MPAAARHAPEAAPDAVARRRPCLAMLPQPDDTTCGPTCLQAVYGFWGDSVSLDDVNSQIPRLPTGGTLTAILARHALRAGYRASIHSYNLQIFDPTWFDLPAAELVKRLQARMRYKRAVKQRLATRNYLRFLEEGGALRFGEDLTPRLLRHYVKERGIPVLTGLSSTYLYRSMREHGPRSDFDDLRGDPSGHFVVLCGWRPSPDDPGGPGDLLVADPLYPNPFATTHHYYVPAERVVCAILLGTLTYDANLLIIEPPFDGRDTDETKGNGIAIPPL